MTEIEEVFAPYFKPEIQKRGRELHMKGLAFILNASDIQVEGYVKSVPPLKVIFCSADIASSSFVARCSCSSGAKGVFCKHMWAMLLSVQLKNPDFLDSKTEIEMGKAVDGKKYSQSVDYKEKQADFKKRQYEKKKVWAQKKRLEKKRKAAESTEARAHYPTDVEGALRFFTDNGFEMPDLPHIDFLKRAKKQLAYVFHPDKGGTHDEAITLNRQFEILEKILNLQKSSK